MSQTRGLPPGPSGLPGVGSLIQFRRDPLGFVDGVHRAFGDVATARLLNRQVVMFFRPEYAHYFLVDHARDFAAGSDRDIMKRFLGEALLTTDGDVHRRQRRMVQPAFHKRRVEGYAEIMTQQTRDMVGAWKVGSQIDIAAALQELTLRIVVEALFKLDLSAHSSRLSSLFSQVIESQSPGVLGVLPVELLDTRFMPTHRAFEARRELDRFVYRLIDERRAEGRDQGDVLSMLLEARDEDGSALSDLQVRDQTMTLMAAGHETTSNALAWTFYLLSRNPQVYAKLLEELARVLGDRTPIVDDLAALPYLDAVITESMRVFPPVWSLNRTALVPFALAGYEFAAGTRVIFGQWIMHHLPDVWDDPWQFRPERWEPAARQQIPKGAYFPFGAGPRICIGMPLAEIEARLVLATILQHVTPHVVPGWPVVPLPRVTLRLKHGLGVSLEPAHSMVAAHI